MGSFVEDLWSSIFTPGPTPTLLIATNVTFAALQALLFALLLATYSIHFVVLSFLSGALWWSINWFAREVREVQRAEKEKEKEKESRMETTEVNTKKTPTGLDSTESDTETEILSRQKKAASPASQPTTTSASLQPPDVHGEARKRLSISGDSSGYGSTDSEWEKVDDSSNAS